MDEKILIKTTGAIGDTIMASALQQALNEAEIHTGVVSKGFTLSLWDGLENVSMYTFEDELPDARIVDISNYLSHMPHSRDMRLGIFGEEGRAHLCKWMAYDSYLGGIPLEIVCNVTPNGVRVVLTQEEVEFGRDVVHKISMENGSRSVVVFNPYSTTKNRNLHRETLEGVVEGIKDFAVPCLLEPLSSEQYVEGMVSVGNSDLRRATAILLASDVYVGVDSGPLHMINGAINGFSAENVDGINAYPEKVIAVLGSSGEKVVAYDYNQVIFSTGGCLYAPCGAHGYGVLEDYERRFKDTFYPSDNPEKDKGGCIYYSHTHPNIDSAVCMQSIPAEQIIETIKQSLK